MRKLISYLLMIAISAIVVSCSKMGEPTGATSLTQDNNFPLISEDEMSVSHAINNDRGVFGAWEVKLNPDTLEAEIIPARNAQAIGDIYDADLSQFLTVSPCSNCLRIVSITLTGLPIFLPLPIYYWNIEFGLKHPFSNINTRPDLHGFDVRAIFVFKDNSTKTYNQIKVRKPDGTDESAKLSTMLMNQDGFTSHFDELVSDSRYFVGGTDCPGNLNPYLRFFNDYSDAPFNPHAPAGHNVIPVGSDFQTRNAIIEGGVISFYIIADVAYGHSAVYSNRTDPQYYLPSFHRTEPWRVEYWLENNYLGGSPYPSGPTADFVVQIFDWQHNATVDPNYPNPSNLSGVRELSRVAGIELSIPSLDTQLYSSSVPETGNATLSDPLKYRIQIRNQSGATSEFVTGLLAVRDELHGQVSPYGRMPVPETPSGFPYATLDIQDYTLYELVYINIPVPEVEELYDNEISQQQFTAYQSDRSISFNMWARFFMDPSGSKFRYVWDSDFDGMIFDIDAEGMPGSFSALEPGRNDVGLGVLTNSVPQRQYIYTLPTYVSGTAMNTLFDTGSLHESVSNTKGHSIATASDNYYVTFMSNMYGKWDVLLAIYDYKGNENLVGITNFMTQDCFNPSIVVVEDGPDEGIYIVFSVFESGKKNIYSMRGNLNGTGFDSTNLKLVAAAAGNSMDNPVLLYNENGKLFTYFNSFNTTTFAINVRGASSNNMGETWTSHGAIDTSVDTNRNNVTAVYSSDTNEVICVWEDYRNYGSRLVDLYIARSSDGISFSSPINISSSLGNEVDISPSASIYKKQFAVAYCMGPMGSNLKARLKVIDIGSMTFTDYAIQYENAYMMTKPSVATCVKNKFTVAYGAFNTVSNTLIPCAVEIDFSDSISNPIEKTILSRTPITLTDITYMNVGVVNRQVAYGAGVENLLVWTSHENGILTGTAPYFIDYGNLRIRNIITDGNSSYSWY